MSQLLKTHYTSVPPTTDTDYWFVKSTGNKTLVFSPIDPELHRELLIQMRAQRPIQPNPNLHKKRRYEVHTRR